MFLFFLELQPLELHRNKRQINLMNTTLKINKLISELKPHICQSKGVMCSPGPPAVHPDREERKEPGDEEDREGNKETKEIKELWDHQEKVASKASWDLLDHLA